MRSLRFASIALMALVGAPTIASASLGTYVDDFTTTTHRDAVHTSVVWDTQLGEIRLPEAEISIAGTINVGTIVQEAVLHEPNLVLLAADNGGLKVVDVSDPTVPTLVTTVTLGARAYGLCSAGRYVYVAVGTGGIKVVDCADPRSPVEIGSWGPSLNVTDLVVDGSHAFVADGDHLRVLDISDPTTPVEVGSYASTCHDVAVAGNLALLAAGTDGLVLVDVTDPTTPSFIGGYATTRASVALARSGNTAYLAAGADGLIIVDITDPSAPARVSSIATASVAVDVEVDAEFVYVAQGDGLEVFDVQDPTQPTLLQSLTSPGTSVDVALAGRLGFLSDSSSGLHTIFIATEGEPLVHDPFSLPTYALRIRVEGDVGYLADGLGLHVLDLQDPCSPQMLGEVPGIDARDVALAGDHAYVAAGASGLLIFDVEDPANPVQIGSYAVGGEAHAVIVDGNVALVMRLTAGSVFLVDVEDPTAPTPIYDDHTSRDYAFALGLIGDYMLVATEDAGATSIQLVDVSNPSAPVTLDEYVTSSLIVTFATQGSRIYAGGLHGTMLFTVDPSTQTLVLEAQDSDIEVSDLTIVGDRLYTAGSFGLYVFDAGTLAFGSELMTGAMTALSHAGDRLLASKVVSGGTYLLNVVDVFNRRFDVDANEARSLNINPVDAPVVAGRVITDHDEEIDWYLSVDGGNLFYANDPGADYQTFSTPDTDLRWRSLHTDAGCGFNATGRELQVDWLYEFAPIISVTDIPNDQGRQVRLRWRQSGYDGVSNADTITDYVIFRRIDSMIAPPTPEGPRRFGPGHGDREFPPGDWDYVMSVPAMGDEIYSTVVPTLGDSTIADGMHWSVFFVRALTDTPGGYYDAPPDSGYSVDDLAPSAPMNLQFEDAVTLAWDEAAEADFDYFTVYGSWHDVLDETAQVIGHTTATTMNVEGFGWYHVTATDFSGNEGEAGSIGSIVTTPDAGVPTAFALGLARPNPANHAVDVMLALPEPSDVTARVYSVTGARIRTLAESIPYPSGRHPVRWDGRNDQGQQVSPGIYFVEVAAIRAGVGVLDQRRKVVWVR